MKGQAMRSLPADPYDRAQQALASWHSTHPRATLAEMEAAVEEQIAQLRAHLLEAQAATAFAEERPLCQHCGTTMVPRARSIRTLLLPKDEPLPIERSYVVCPQCGAGLFPPG
jgi:uncharacterized protein with PIN domain